ncbi:hypothetical protein [Arthrobacter sp. H14-L1]|uniref:PH-like domain-containing protein n=1 Tax=Arthrobacter sp. H14-L1 TaxID=2996697 RepID=UPI00226F4C97|nr:hypothetical protein [Arthrobacter sp. H14-L1]MCY0903768.1 hypothetical protein [Arthrobacter sp. H14-L1]
MARLFPTLLAVALVVVIFALLWMGWRHRLQRQAGIAPLPAVPQQLSAPLASAEGQYVVTTTEGDWLDRLAVHGLGIRSNAVLSVHPEGILISRSGAPDVFIPKDSYGSARTESGMAGKFVERDGLIVLSWRLGGHPVDTGFRTRQAAAKTPLLTMLTDFAPIANHSAANHPAANHTADNGATGNAPVVNGTVVNETEQADTGKNEND